MGMTVEPEPQRGQMQQGHLFSSRSWKPWNAPRFVFLHKDWWALCSVHAVCFDFIPRTNASNGSKEKQRYDTIRKDLRPWNEGREAFWSANPRASDAATQLSRCTLCPFIEKQWILMSYLFCLTCNSMSIFLLLFIFIVSFVTFCLESYISIGSTQTDFFLHKDCEPSPGFLNWTEREREKKNKELAFGSDPAY